MDREWNEVLRRIKLSVRLAKSIILSIFKPRFWQELYLRIGKITLPGTGMMTPS